MGELGDRVDRLARKQRASSEEEHRKRDQLRVQFRVDMPEVAEVVDSVRGVFGEDCRVLFASEGGKCIGTNRGKWLGIDD